MKARICPKCRCIYTDGRAECIDCGVFTQKAAEEDIEVFEDKLAEDSERLYEKLDRVDSFYRNERRKGDTAKGIAVETILRLLLP